MLCLKCGTQIPDIAKFCPVCGSVVTSENAPASEVASTVKNTQGSVPGVTVVTLQPETPSADYQPMVISANPFVRVPDEAPQVIAPQPVVEPQVIAPQSVVEPQSVSTSSPAVLFSPAAPVLSASQESTVPPQAVTKPPKKGPNAKVILIAVAVIAAALLIAAGVFFLRSCKSSTGNTFKLASDLLIISETDKSLIYGAGDKAMKVDGYISSYMYSMDGKVAAFSLDPDDMGIFSLSFCNGKKVFDVADDVYSFSLSSSGSKILYLTDYDSDTQTGVLYLYDVASDKSEKVVKDAYKEFVISPDGGSIAYSTDVSLDDYGYLDGLTGYVKIGDKKAEKLDDDQYAFALSNKGNYIYYVDADLESSGETNLYVRHGKSDEKIGKVELSYGFYLNSDYSEVIFSSGSNTYISVKGAGKEKIMSTSNSRMVLPDKIQYSSNSVYSAYAYVVNIPSFLDKLYLSTNDDYSEVGIVYLQKDLNTEDIDTFGSQYAYFISPNGKAFYFIDDSGNIVIYKDFRDLKADPDKIKADADIQDFVVTPDQSAVFYIDADNTLWVVRGDSDPEEIDKDVQSGYLNLSKDGKGVYYLTDYTYDENTYIGQGTLYFVNNKKNADPGKIAKDVNNYLVSDYGTVYYVFDHTDETTYQNIGKAYLSTNNKDFEVVSKNALIW